MADSQTDNKAEAPPLKMLSDRFNSQLNFTNERISQINIANSRPNKEITKMVAETTQVADVVNSDDLIVLPSSDKYRNYVKVLPYAEIGLDELTEDEIINGATPNPIWKGPLNGVAFIGYPYVATENVYGEDAIGEKTRLISSTRKLMDIGIPLMTLYYSSEHHAFACVRSDVYVIA